MGTLDGKRALVTGGSRGIGAAIVRRLAAEGASVAVNYRSGAEAAEALVTELTDAGHEAVALQGDITDPSSSQALVSSTVEAFGGLELLASNAGVEHFGALESLTWEDFDRVFRANVGGQLFAAQAAAAAMDEGGRIVLTSSVSAQIAVHQHSLYAASKAAVSAMVANLAPELARRHIAINAIAPGGTNTPMAEENARHYLNPVLRDVSTDTLPEADRPRLFSSLGRLADPEEIAAAVAFLLGPDASYITGSTLAVDGGRL